MKVITYKELIKILGKFHGCINEAAMREIIVRYTTKKIWHETPFEINSSWFKCEL